MAWSLKKWRKLHDFITCCLIAAYAFIHMFLKVDTFRVLSRLGINGVMNDA